MTIDIRYFFLVLFVFFQLGGTAQTDQPKVGLVLSGGGAKGLAHIGAIKVLEANGIRPDYITGTSMGSIIGGLYAMGYTSDQLDSLARTLTWDDFFNDKLTRNYVPLEERSRTDRYQVSFPLEDGKIKLPRGFVYGHKLTLLFSGLSIPIHQVENFDDLDIPFRCIAADCETGEAYVFDKGYLPTALRASMSIPSVFEPVEYDGKLLVDGGIVRNLPVQDAIDMGADIIIAVDVGGDLYSKEELTSIVQVLEQAGSFRGYELNQEEFKKADIIIRPNLKDFSTLNFDVADSLIVLGEEAALQKIDSVKLLLPNRPIPGPRKEFKAAEKNYIQAIEIKGVEKKEAGVLKGLLQMRTPGHYTTKEIESRMKTLLGSQFVGNLQYRLFPASGGLILEVEVDYQSGSAIQASINYDSNLKAGLLFNATLRGKLGTGSRLSFDFKLSENPLINLDYLIYTRSRPSFGFNLNARAHYYPGFFYEEGEKSFSFDIQHFESQARFISGINNRFLVSLGAGYERYSQGSRFFSTENEELRLNQGNVLVTFSRDTYDRLSFPTEGSYTKLEGRLAFSGSLKEVIDGGKTTRDGSNLRVRLQVGKLFPMGNKWALQANIDGGVLAYANESLINQFYLGREIPDEISHVEFVGLDYMEQPATAYGVAAVKLRHALKPNIFLSLLANYGYYDVRQFDVMRANNLETFLSNRDAIYGVGVQLGALTLIGPAYFNVEYNPEENDINLALHLGYNF